MECSAFIMLTTSTSDYTPPVDPGSILVSIARLNCVNRYTNRCCGVGVSAVFMCSFVCLFFSKADAARIAKHDTEMFHHESWKSVHFGDKSSKVEVTRHKKTFPAWVSYINLFHRQKTVAKKTSKKEQIKYICTIQ